MADIELYDSEGVPCGMVSVPSKPFCMWAQNTAGDWETGCEKVFSIDDGSPSDNDMGYCCYCGGVIMVLAPPA